MIEYRTWENKLQNLIEWYKTCIVKPQDHLNLWEHFKMAEMEGAVLDVGAGQKKGTWLKNKFSNKVRYTGIDPVPADDSILRGTAEALPFFDGAFNYVICISTLQHTLDPEKAVSEIHRVLKTHGKICATVYLSKVNDLIAHEFSTKTAGDLFNKKFLLNDVREFNNVCYISGLKP